MASIYLPPIARKKRVDGYPRHDTSRVFADFQGERSPVQTSYGAHYVGHALGLSPMQSLSAGRNNKPHPHNVTFLRQNPRFICEPICHVKTSFDPQEIHHPWWPEEVPEKPARVPQRSLDSTARSDYRHPPPAQDQSTRYRSSPQMAATEVGTISQSDPKPKTVKEKISYEHQFNSRLDPSQPIRGRRHGSFIWKVVSQIGKQNKNSDKSVEYACHEEETSDSPLQLPANGISDNDQTKDTSDAVEESRPGHE